MKTEKNPKGAGRKPISKRFSDALKRDVFAAMQKKAKETGQTIGDVIVGMAYSDESKHFNIRPIALKMIQEILLIRETQSTSDVNVSKFEGPAIGLPPIDTTPIVPEKKEIKEGAALH